MIDCPCVELSRALESEWIEVSSKAIRNVGDLWAFHKGLQSIAEREIERLNRKLIAATHDTVASLRGYRRERNDGNPCDAEKRAVSLLRELGEHID